VIALRTGEYDPHAVALKPGGPLRGRYYGVYHAKRRPEVEGAVDDVPAVSDDLVHWEKYPGNPVIRSDDSSGNPGGRRPAPAPVHHAPGGAALAAAGSCRRLAGWLKTGDGPRGPSRLPCRSGSEAGRAGGAAPCARGPRGGWPATGRCSRSFRRRSASASWWAAGRAIPPRDRAERRLVKALRKAQRRRDETHDRALVGRTGIREAREASVFVPPPRLLAAPAPQTEPAREVAPAEDLLRVQGQVPPAAPLL